MLRRALILGCLAACGGGKDDGESAPTSVPTTSEPTTPWSTEETGSEVDTVTRSTPTGSDTAPDTGSDTGTGPAAGCTSLFAATLADASGIACDAPLPVAFHTCPAGGSPNECQAQLWDDPVEDGNDAQPFELVWAHRCVDGSDDCDPRDDDAVVCVDGTRPYFYVEPGVTADGSPSDKWMFRWHNGQTSKAQLDAGCAFSGTCGDPMGS